MAKILLDYVFPISVVTPTPQASTAFLKQVCLVCTPKSGQEGNVGELYECSSMSQVAARTDNTNAQQLFNAGMSKVYILLSDDLDLETEMDEYVNQFYTVLISDDFDETDFTTAQAQGTVTVTSYANLVSGTEDVVTVAGTAFTAQAGAATPGAGTFQAASSNDATATSLAAQINAHEDINDLVEATAVGAVVTIKAKDAGWDGNDITLAYTDNDTNVGITLAGLSGGKLSGGAGLFLGVFEGVVGLSNDDAAVCRVQAAVANRCGFFVASSNGAKNLCYSFGKLLSSTSWRNQQFITMPFDDGVDLLGEANSLFDDRVSFVIADSEFSTRLGFFAAGGKAIVAPYILKNLRIDLQSAALSWISGNQPQYTLKEATLLETRLQQDVIQQKYIDTNLIESGTVEITLVNSNFVATGDIVVTEPKALWKVVSEMIQTA